MKTIMVYLLINTLTGAPLTDASGHSMEYRDIGHCTVAATNIMRAMHTTKSDLYRCVPIPVERPESVSARR